MDDEPGRGLNQLNQNVEADYVWPSGVRTPAVLCHVGSLVLSMGVGVCRRGLLHMGGNAVTRVAEIAAGPKKVLSETGKRIKAMHRCYAELSALLLDPSWVRNVLLTSEKLKVR